MADDLFSLLRAAIERRDEVGFRMVGVGVILRPYVLYDSLSGQLKMAGMTTYDMPVHITVAQIEDLFLTGRRFEPDPALQSS